MSSSSNNGKKPAAGGGRGGPTIRTLADLSRRPSPAGLPGGGGGSDSDEPQEYYTGGEKSGMLVQDPTKRNDVDSIFEQARQMGILQGPPPPEPDQSSSSGSFTGTGRLLSGETVPSAAPQQPHNVIHNIQFWNNGFTVNDGPLRRFDDPQNADFLESIKKSECPRELEPEPADRRKTVHVSLIKRHEDYQEPAKLFQGVGRTLGGGSSSVQSSGSAPAVEEPRTASKSVGITVDDSLPYTSIQLRLADGTRMVARFNMQHTVGDIRAFIDASRPGAAMTYRLQTGFPPKQLTDLTQTIEQAGLANSVLIQKL